MDQKDTSSLKSFMDYIYVIYKWKKFIIINTFIVAIISTVFAFLIPKTYKATAVVTIPPQNSNNLGGFASLLSDNSSIVSLGSKLLGGTSGSMDVLLGILNSRTALTDVIQKFNLINYYGIKDSNMDKTLKAFRGDISFDQNEFGMIEISVINKDPKESAEIANYFTTIMDSINIALNTEQAKNNRIFIEKRYNKNQRDLKSAEDSLYNFQKKYGVLVVPDQLDAGFKAAAELEAELVKKELTSELLQKQYGDNSPLYKSALAQVDFFKKKIASLKNSPSITNQSNFLIPFKKAPDLLLKYYKYYRDLKIQTKIMEVILPLSEQAKVTEQNNIPTIMVLDKAVPPNLKYRPKKAFIILGITFPLFIMFMLIAFRGEIVYKRENFKNPLERKETNFYKKLTNIFKLSE